ncbi:hypothetical protein [Armatimonas sp.]|uniref:hypothetical protein n=1 Tax=Armatimonas sp. TaxID=1872638 RepID=UPI003750E3EC
MSVRWLVVTNPSDEPFSGVAVLHADYRTRTIAPVIVADPQGNTVPSRITNETLGEPDVEGDGKRHWVFDMEFFCECAPTLTVAYTARFGDDPTSEATEEQWVLRSKEGVSLATESEKAV